MKKVLVKNTMCPILEPAEWFIIENWGDLMEYAIHLGVVVSRMQESLLKTDVPMDKWDHLTMKGQEKALFGMALMQRDYKAKNPVMNLVNIGEDKIYGFAKHLMRGKKILLNKNGGYCFAGNGMEIVEYLGNTPLSVSRVQPLLREESGWIVLENDPILPEESKSFLEKKDPNYSAIFDLRYYSQSELAMFLDIFTSDGGHTVFVYTTGMDVKQMWEYSETIINSQITHVVFSFTQGKNDAINEVIDHLLDKGVFVKEVAI